MDWQARIWGYTGGVGMIQALAAGYFLWDLVVTSLNMDVFGPGTLAHAISALVVFSFGFRPFVNYYAPVFILWELSTPFLNIHWFFDKLGMTGTKPQLYNGLMLLFTFFSCRLVYGTYQSVKVFGDIWAAMSTSPNLDLLTGTAHSTDTELLRSGVMRFATATSTVPTWLAAAYLASNLTLNGLNFYWFVMMIRAVRKRFQPSKAVTGQEKNDNAVLHAADSAPTATRPRRRKA
ncbi:hypothetical protein ACHAQA_009157 [Verticillium albo-atrum]